MAKLPLSFTVNGEPRQVFVQPWQTLLEALRDELALTGTKEGCSNGNCGACTVLLDGRAIVACCMLALEAEGQDILTIEGLAKDGRLDPLQETFIEYGALQCGFCTPGFLLSARALLNTNPAPNEQEVRLAIAGNLCRCTGYDKIVRAIQAAVEREA
ncbi:MAG: (2Fe-2S)-binding protein [Chloroflexi bacterium]|nr:(2Fe-2S)-binding protein [Chloroflexota bacterium]